MQLLGPLCLLQQLYALLQCCSWCRKSGPKCFALMTYCLQPAKKVLYSRKIWWGIKFGSLAVRKRTAKFVIYRCLWSKGHKPPNLNSRVLMVALFEAKPPNLIPTNISGYME